MKTLIFENIGFPQCYNHKIKNIPHACHNMCILNVYINRIKNFMTQIMRCVKYELIKGNQNHNHFLRSQK